MSTETDTELDERAALGELTIHIGHHPYEHGMCGKKREREFLPVDTALSCAGCIEADEAGLCACGWTE